MGEDAEPDRFWDPGDPHGLRMVRRALVWMGGIFAVWATARVYMLGGNYLAYYAVAVVLLLAAFLVEPLVGGLRRRREPF